VKILTRAMGGDMSIQGLKKDRLNALLASKSINRSRLWFRTIVVVLRMSIRIALVPNRIDPAEQTISLQNAGLLKPSRYYLTYSTY